MSVPKDRFWTQADVVEQLIAAQGIVDSVTALPDAWRIAAFEHALRMVAQLVEPAPAATP